MKILFRKLSSSPMIGPSRRKTDLGVGQKTGLKRNVLSETLKNHHGLALAMDIELLKEEQLAAAKKVITNDLVGEVKLIGGADCAYANGIVIASIVVCDENLAIVEKKTATAKSDFPFIPGLLYYREGKAIKEAFSKLNEKPDVLLVDG